MFSLRNTVAGLMATLLVAACSTGTAPEAPWRPGPPDPGLAAVMAAWKLEEDHFLNNDPPPVDPIDHLMWRDVHCQFLLGELSGDRELDKGVDEGREELQCRKLVVDARRLRSTPGLSPDDASRLDALFARYPD